MTKVIEVRPGVYHDSVSLMQLSQVLTEDEAVAHAQVAMGTVLNLDLLVDIGYDRPSATAADLVIAVDATDDEQERIRALVDRLLAESGLGRPPSEASETPCRTVRTAVRTGATVALISVPGVHAFREALEAIEAGAHPVIFSDGVSVEQEIVIKRRANAAGLVAMGPDCGTVILDGVGLGFANAVVPGPIGLVSASGTGAQQVCTLADHAGVGVRHVLGLGGRDLRDEVGGLSALPAIRLLDADPAIEVIGVVAKDSGEETGAAVNRLRNEIETPIVLVATRDLTAGTVDLLSVLGRSLPDLPTWSPPTIRHRGQGRILGLYSGGTLAAEAGLVLAEAGTEAEIIDLGDDRYTQGRPHPMIDFRLRLERFAQAAESDDVGAVLLDVVLGHGAADDPAAALGSAIAAAPIPVVVALIGTANDPQGIDRQAEALAAAGATVMLSNSAAAREVTRS